MDKLAEFNIAGLPVSLVVSKKSRKDTVTVVDSETGEIKMVVKFETGDTQDISGELGRKQPQGASDR